VIVQIALSRTVLILVWFYVTIADQGEFIRKNSRVVYHVLQGPFLAFVGSIILVTGEAVNKVLGWLFVSTPLIAHTLVSVGHAPALEMYRVEKCMGTVDQRDIVYASHGLQSYMIPVVGKCQQPNQILYGSSWHWHQLDQARDIISQQGSFVNSSAI
jgi:hypothetical protein